MIVPLFKPVGITTHQLAQQLARFTGEKSTHTGSLDPLASGVVVGLTGDDRFKKVELNNGQKTYTWDMLIGIQIDTHDLMGLIQKIERHTPDSEELITQFSLWSKTIQPTYEQDIPSFSAKRCQGTDFSRLSKQGLCVPKISQTVQIFDISITQIDQIPLKNVALQAVTQINKVSGEFRQKECIQQWESTKKIHGDKLFSRISCKAVVGKKTYIRGLVRDFSVYLGVGCTTINLVRTHNGQHAITDCVCFI